MKLLFAYYACGLGGVETSILHKFEALRRSKIEAVAIFSEFYGEGGRALTRDSRVHVGLTRRQTKELLVNSRFDAISVIDYPEFLEVIEETQISARVFFESHVPPPKQRSYAALRNAAISAVIVPSEFNRRAVAPFVPRTTDLAVVRCPIDVEAFRSRTAGPESASGYRGASASEPIILWVGRLEDAKNPEELICIANLVHATRPDVRFWIVGDSPFYDTRKAHLIGRADEATRPALEFIRTVPYDQMPALYAATASSRGTLLSTSRHESLPMVLLEAMTCGCPVVATDIAGISELVSDGSTGRLYRLGDAKAAAAAVCNTIDPAFHSEREIRTREARTFVVAHHSLDVVGTQYHDLIVKPRVLSSTPLVSTVIPFVNSELYLEEAIDSVVAQTYPNWELLLVDDGATDTSRAIAERYVERYPSQIRCLSHPKGTNRGRSASRNLGITHGRGEFVAFLDSDDVWAPHKLVESLALLEANPEAAMVFGSTLRWHSWTLYEGDRDRDFLVRARDADRLFRPPEILTAMLNNLDLIPAPCSVLIRRSSRSDDQWFDEQLDAFEDLAMYAHIFVTQPVFVASRSWARHRQHPDMSSVVSLRTGQWHPISANEQQRRFLVWLADFLTRHHVTDRELWRVLDRKLAPYQASRLGALKQTADEIQRLGRRAFVAGMNLYRATQHQRSASIAATPNPVHANESGSATTTVAWAAPGVTTTEIRLDAPDGPLYLKGGDSGEAKVTLWPGRRVTFYLQEASQDEQPSLRRTLAIRSVAALPASEPSCEPYSLVMLDEDRPRTMLRLSGRTLLPGAGTIAGCIERLDSDADGGRISGWAASMKHGAAACRIVAFSDGRFLTEGVTGIGRDDLAAQSGIDQFRFAGFELTCRGVPISPSTLRLFAISSAHEAMELRAGMPDRARHRYMLGTNDGGARFVIDQDGRRTMPPGVAHGFVERVRFGSSRLALLGWTADVEGGPSRDVAIFVDGQFVCAGPPRIERPDVVTAFQTEANRYCGFSFNVPYLRDTRTVPTVTILAISQKEVAYELPLLTPVEVQLPALPEG